MSGQQQALDARPAVTSSLSHDDQRNARLSFPPSYCLVGVYRLLHDPQLRTPIWAKCQHGVVRGSIVGLVWAVFTYKAQKAFIETFLMKSPRVTGLSNTSMFGITLPLATYATFIFLSSQANMFMRFFLSKNLRIARERAWDQTVQSRGKGPEFWQPYVEEWQKPPVVRIEEHPWKKSVSAWLSQWVLTKIILSPLNLYPIVGMLVSAYFKAMMTGRYLHLPYFKAKQMSPTQVAVFIEERKWDYRMFGFVAALLEGLPLIGLFFSVSNRIGSAMWAHDLEKRQHDFASGKLQQVAPIQAGGMEMQPPKTVESRLGAVGDVKARAAETLNKSGRFDTREASESMAGSWDKL